MKGLATCGCGWCASRNLPDYGTVAFSDRLSQVEDELVAQKSSLLRFKQKPWCAGEHLDALHAIVTDVDAARHSCLAMDNNPLHTTASGRNLGPIFLGVDWAIFSLSTIIVALRLYTRLFITRNFGLDDATIALTQARRLSFQQLLHSLIAGM